MPMYKTENTHTGEITTHLCSWETISQFLADNSSENLVPAAPAIVSGVAGLRKPDEGFRDVLRNIKQHHRGSSIDVP